MSRFEIVILKCPLFWVCALLAWPFIPLSYWHSQRVPCFLLSRYLLGTGDLYNAACSAGPGPTALCLEGGCWNGESDPSALGLTHKAVLKMAD